MQVTCQCGRMLRLDEQFAGKQVRCPLCKHVFVAPSADTVLAMEEAQVPRGLDPHGETYGLGPGEELDERKPEPVRRPARRRPIRDEEDEEEEEAPRPRRKRRRSFFDRHGPPGTWPITRFVDFVSAIMVIGGIVIIFHAIQNMRLASASSSQPQQLTLKQLIANGPGNNNHVIVTDFTPAANYVYRYQKGKYEVVSNPETKRWTEVWVPLVVETNAAPQPPGFNPGGFVPGGIGPRPSAVQVVVRLEGTHDKIGVDQWCNSKRQVQGMVVNLTESLDSKTEELLKEAYPATDFSRLLIIHEGRKPTTASTVLLEVCGGTVMIVLGGLWFMFRLVFRNAGA
jgi:hypothetical protein